jgi:hypothetical protein
VPDGVDRRDRLQNDRADVCEDHHDQRDFGGPRGHVARLPDFQDLVNASAQAVDGPALVGRDVVGCGRAIGDEGRPYLGSGKVIRLGEIVRMVKRGSGMRGATHPAGL